MESSLGVIVGSALFQPVSLVAIFVLMPLPMAAARVAFGLGLLVVVPLVARLGKGRTAAVGLQSVVECAVPTLAGTGDVPRSSPKGWGPATGETVVAFGRNAIDFAYRFGPPMLIASFPVGAVFTIASPERLSEITGSDVALIIAFAAVGTFLQVPGMFEIPLTLGVLALGLGAGPATALLLTLPSTGLVTLGITRRDFGWRVPSLMLLATFVGGVIASMIVGAV